MIRRLLIVLCGLGLIILLMIVHLRNQRLPVPATIVSGDIWVETYNAVPVDFRSETSYRESRHTFMNARYDLLVRNGDQTVTIPGFFVGGDDGSTGNLWRAYVSSDEAAELYVEQRFCTGENVALLDEDDLVSATCVTDRLTIQVRNDLDEAFVEEGTLVLPPPVRQVGTRYLQRQDGSVFLKSGAGSPENILAYADFDGTVDVGGTAFPALGENQLHEFEPHLRDTRSGDPVWRNGKGAGLLGLFNYYEAVGVNSQYLVGMNLHGDGQDVFPYVSPDDPYIFDVSKLAQWQTVFEHANRRGVLIHFLFTETENESFFEVHDDMEPGVDFAPSRKLYFREMIARFGHLPMLIWNLGEENGVTGNTGADPYRYPTTPRQRLDFTDYIAALDWRDHPIVSHNWPNEEDALYGPKLGHPTFSGISLQAHEDYFDKVAEWTERSNDAGRPWMVMVDEPLGWEFGARPDAGNARRNEILTVMWPSLLGGSAGVEWYFGWQNNAPTSDLSNEDQRSRDQLWKDSARVRAFFETLPLADMTPQRDGETMILEGAGYKLAMTGDVVTFSSPENPERRIDPFNPG